MQSYVPKTITKCWTHHDIDPDITVKACEVLGINTETNEEERRVIKTSKNQDALFGGMFVQKCDPKKDKSCPITIGNSFYKQCDPKKDKKCEIKLDDLLFG